MKFQWISLDKTGAPNELTSLDHISSKRREKKKYLFAGVAGPPNNLKVKTKIVKPPASVVGGKVIFIPRPTFLEEMGAQARQEGMFT